MIICIGSASKDIFFLTDKGVVVETPDDLTSQRKLAFELGAKYKIEERHESLGGCAANAAAGLLKLGIDAGCAAAIGDDIVSSWIEKELEKQGIGTEFLMRNANCLGNLSAIVVDKKSGDRVIFSSSEASKKMDVETAKLGNPDWIFIGDVGSNWKKDLEEIVKFGKDNDIHLAFNPRQSHIHEDAGKISEVITSCEVLILNKDEAIEILTARNSQLETQKEKYLIKELKRSGVKIVAITDGRRGAWTYDGKDIMHAEVIGENPVETTGAGDAFASGFIGALMKGKSTSEALKWGIANSGNSVKFYGAIEGLLKEEEIGRLVGNIKIEKIN